MIWERVAQIPMFTKLEHCVTGELWPGPNCHMSRDNRDNRDNTDKWPGSVAGADQLSVLPCHK